MQIVGHKLTKILGERKGTLEGNKSINFKIDVPKVEIRDIFIGGEKRKSVDFDFKYEADYNGNSSLILEGTLMAAGDEKDLKKIEKDWKADKIDPEIDALVKNRVMSIATGKMVPLAEGLGLPLPVRFPGRFVPQSEKKK